jgi:hypothetical protein
MDNRDFEKTDVSWMKRLGALCQKPIPPEILKGFRASVEDRIRQNQAQRQRKPLPSFSLPVFSWAPALAIVIVAFVVVLRLPDRQNLPLGPRQVLRMATVTSTLAEEIAALREVGAWTNEDEAALGINGDASLDELELSDTD